MSPEFDLNPYVETEIEVLSLRDSVLKRPGMYFGDLHDGSAYAGIVQAMVHATLSWQIGANVGLRLKPNNEIELYCDSGLPQGDKPHEHRWSRPIQGVTKDLALFGDHRLEYCSVACDQMIWELRDPVSSDTVVFQEGCCRSAMASAPNLPIHLCLRVVLAIGTPAIQIAPATIAQVANVLRYMSGPAEAGYWGCVSIEDLRTVESFVVMVTDPPSSPYWRDSPGVSP